MGGDGGVKATSRAFIVTVKKRAEKVDSAEQGAMKWHMCALTAAPLTQPILADKAGNLFNKESLLQYMLAKAKGERSIGAFSHIRSLKDTCELTLTVNPEYVVHDIDSEKGVVPSMSSQAGQFACPITGLETNGRNRFAVLWTCGCVFSEKALKEVVTPACLSCGKPFKPSDVVKLAMSDDETADARIALLEAHKVERAVKKAKKDAAAAAAEACEGPSSSAAAGAGAPLDKKHKHGDGAPAAAVVKKSRVLEEPARAPTAVAEAEAKVDTLKSKSSLYASLFNSSRPAASGDDERKNLFIRTATPLYTQNRGST